ncbi:unnamed protein product [Cladocopium goreaui]|uniref:RING-type domain-containing protein n=1 Tax=Cladocopium goreaui TaxID=2562237 RepID=A0A9P1BQE9_9DINO|nr:unnamed protein product [Cladocopium goreaui]
MAGCQSPSDKKTYRVVLDRQADGSPLGLIIAQHPRVDGLVISAVMESEAIREWNEAHPDKPVQRGLALLEINEVSDSQGMVHECCNAPSLNMLVSQQLTPEQTLAFRKGLRKHLLSQAVDQIIEIPESCGGLCAICHEDMATDEALPTSVAKIPCGHCFHRSCVTKWLVSGSQRCPLCNRAVHLDISTED